VNIGGVTLHKWAGCGLLDKPVGSLVAAVRRNKEVRNRWQTSSVLVIDECSMLDCELFETLEQMARTIRGKNEPFGGLQIVLCGDFFQLPPVKKNGRPIFCFMSEYVFFSIVFSTSN